VTVYLYYSNISLAIEIWVVTRELRFRDRLFVLLNISLACHLSSVRSKLITHFFS